MDDLKSKSQKKREAAALQKVGEALVTLSEDVLNTLPLDPRLKQTILDAKHLKSHGAIRRQAQLIGKLMRGDESALILRAYDQLCAERKAKTAGFQEAEQWRQRFIDGDTHAITAFVDTYSDVDVQHLRQLIRKAISEQHQHQTMGASKVLFRYIKGFCRV